ncbi:MAG: hypothetical protein Q4D41_05970 [Prevotellaceae bacterium]|nr:hypothetical protein [Bacteroidales bacterium]MDO4159983.1 hypothetical protein [Prevotellaceae bacterium]
MKKLIILATLLLGMAHAAFAEKRGVLMEIHYRSVPGKNMSVNRAPMRLPIEVVYDSDTHRIKVTGNESMDAEVFLYNANGDLENYSSSLNTEFTVLTPGIYIIQIQGDGWYAEGEIEVE